MQKVGEQAQLVTSKSSWMDGRMQCHLPPAAPAVKNISICKRARASHGGRRARIQNINIGKCAAIQPSDQTLLCPGRIFLSRPVGGWMQRGGGGSSNGLTNRRGLM